jgi:hypothetical protein
LTADVPQQLHLARKQYPQELRRLSFDEDGLARIELYFSAEPRQSAPLFL